MPSGKRSRQLRTHPVTPRARARRASPCVLIADEQGLAVALDAVLR